MAEMQENQFALLSNKEQSQNVLLKISNSIIGTLDYEEVLQIISDGMAELFEIETAAIYLLEEDQYLYLGATTPPLEQGMPEEFRKAKLADHPHIEKAIIYRSTQLVLDTQLEELSPSEQLVVKMRKLKSLLYFPFIQKDKVLGVLILGTRIKTRKFSNQEVEFGQTVANQLSIGIKNSLLHHDVQVKNKALLKEIEEREKIETELQHHRDNLEQLVKEKTMELEQNVSELLDLNEELLAKNDIINSQNTELLDTLQNLKEAQSKLIQAEKMASLGVLTAGIAHEINNPLNYIMGAYVALQTYYENNSPENPVFIDKMLRSINLGLKRSMAVVKGLSHYSRDTSDKEEECLVHEILDNCLVMLNNQLKNRVEVIKKYTPGQLIVKGNDGQLHQAFLNVLNNASQAIPEKGEIQVSTLKNETDVIIEVSDTGSGIAPAIINKITDPFFTTKEPGKGTGLGLSITYSIIKEHEGTIEFESKVGKGTTVKIILPNR